MDVQGPVIVTYVYQLVDGEVRVGSSEPIFVRYTVLHLRPYIIPYFRNLPEQHFVLGQTQSDN